MNVLIVATNHYSRPVPVMPVGACMVAEAAELAGHKVRVLDLMFDQNPLNTLELELNKSNPDFIGLSVRNIDNNDMQNPVPFFKDLKPLMDTIRSKTPAPVVLGGAAVSVMPEELLRYTGANWAVLGDGEVSSPNYYQRFRWVKYLARCLVLHGLRMTSLPKIPAL